MVGEDAKGNHQKSERRKMKKCPNCQSIFNLDSITFCPIDGTALLKVAEQNGSDSIAVATEELSLHLDESSGVVQEKEAQGRRMITPIYAIAGVIVIVLLVSGWMIFGNKASGGMKNDIGMEFSWIPPGSFMMGSTTSQIEDALKECKRYYPDCARSSFNAEQPQRLVKIAKGFWMGRHEVTQGQYEAVMGTNPSDFKICGKDCPVEEVSWNDAKEFVKRLNARNDGFVYSLPSEAEWEYAARAGTTTAFAFGDSLSSTQANFDGNYPYGNAPKGPYLEKTTKVGSYRPNAWGLYDMHGNVFEWVEDIYEGSYTGLPTDGSANTTRGDTSLRVLRGGSWLDHGRFTRSALRGWVNPSFPGVNFGFRVVARSR
jgi:formylglycine-generating enzyme required for sulfatase activity